MIWSESVGDGPTIVFTHGWGDSADTWDAQVVALRECARVVRWDLLGHGRSDAPVDPSAYSRELALADLTSLVGDGPAVLVGHSFGGQLSLAFTLRHPDRVSALGLIGTGPGFRDPVALAGWNDGAERRAQKLEAAGDHAQAASIRGYVIQDDASALMAAVPTIKVPVAVVVGAKDAAFLAAADWFERTLPHARKLVVPDAGHAVHQHQPGPVNEVLRALLP